MWVLGRLCSSQLAPKHHTDGSLELSATSPSVLNTTIEACPTLKPTGLDHAQARNTRWPRRSLEATTRTPSQSERVLMWTSQSTLFHRVSSVGLWTFCVQENRKNTKQNYLAVDTEQKGAAWYPQPNAAVNKDGRNHSFIPEVLPPRFPPHPQTFSPLSLHEAEVKNKAFLQITSFSSELLLQ